MPTANFVSDQVVNCYGDVCDVFRNGEWSHLVATMVTRYQHSSAVYQDKVLLIGGIESNTTEWITLDRRVSLGPGHRIHASPQAWLAGSEQPRRLQDKNNHFFGQLNFFQR